MLRFAGKTERDLTGILLGFLQSQLTSQYDILLTLVNRMNHLENPNPNINGNNQNVNNAMTALAV